MKQIWPNYSYSPTTNVLTLTGLNIDRDQLLLVTAADRGRIMYNFADSTTTASAFTAGANTGLTLVASTAGLTTTAALVIYYDDQIQSTAITISNFPASQAVTFSAVSISNFPATQPVSIASVTIGNSVTIGSLPVISGTVTANVGNISSFIGGGYNNLEEFAGAGGIGVNVVDGTVTLGAGTAQIGSVTASISNSVTIASLPAISGTVTANTFALQGTAVTTSNFTSTTASTVLANYNATRQVLTIFNEGAGNLHIAPGATCTTIAYQVRLSSGDYYEVPNHQTTITHSAVFATAGTARICQLS